MQQLAHTMIHQLAHNLAQLPTWIEKAQAHAAARRFDADTLLQHRLAPDMFPLVRQIGSACDTVKLATARLSGRTAPVHTDDQKTWAEVRARVEDVLAFVGTLTEDELAAATDRQIRFPWAPGVKLDGRSYLLRHAIPNFYFHLSMAYAILRHNGVDVGKADFLGPLPWTPDT